MKRKLVISSAIPILVLLLLGVGVGDKTANAWDGGGGCNWKIGPDSYDNGLGAGEQEAIYDHENQISYNPYPQSCQSDVYQNAFHQGYDQQWNSYQSQESTQGASVNLVNSPGAYVSVDQNSEQQQNPLQQLAHTVCGFINCNPQPEDP
jgi:hypothetical protein